ncbi:potassium channel family protein [Vreelandella alkaliphila]|uniref:potassium channel family protein n=1 Tax=Vreelandella alkaliphila TaxID=272774 RepID=UPI00232D7DA4|nr:potassium channel family protein [Halomonas alkaliphila]
MYLAVLIIALLSPTFWLASLLKEGINKAKAIRVLNWVYFLIAIFSGLGLLIAEQFFDTNLARSTETGWLTVLWSIYLLSRCSEIFIAFLRDALDKVAGKETVDRGKWWPKWIIQMKNKLFVHQWIALSINGDSLKNHDRLRLAFRSYFELIVNFAILYLLTPLAFWKDSHMPSGIWESGYFSGVTITTLGYGDITPSHWFPQFLTVFEVLCGFVLIVVCFAVYLQHNKNG